MKNIERYMRAEHEQNSPCVLRVVLLDNGIFRARLSFSPGMESAYAEGETLADAIERLNDYLT